MLLLSEHPECKYAYDLAMERTGDGLYQITFSYMPYRTGDYPADFAGEEAGSFGSSLPWHRSILIRRDPGARHRPQPDGGRSGPGAQQVGGGYLLVSSAGTAPPSLLRPRTA